MATEDHGVGLLADGGEFTIQQLPGNGGGDRVRGGTEQALQPAGQGIGMASGELLAEVIDSQTMEIVSLTSATGCLNVPLDGAPRAAYHRLRQPLALRKSCSTMVKRSRAGAVSF